VTTPARHSKRPSPYDWVTTCIPTTASDAALGTTPRFPGGGDQRDIALAGRKVKL